MKSKVLIVMGSDSDLLIMSEAAQILTQLGIETSVQILSTHRAPDETTNLAKSATDKSFKVIIAGAGGSAALPGSIASHTLLPVIGVPVKSKSLDGIDSLLSIVQMPPGVPVATVGINAAKNAGILAAQIISISDPKVAKALENYKGKIKNEVLEKNKKLTKIGWQKYLQEKH